MIGKTKLLLNILRKTMLIEVMQLYIERLQTLQHCKPNTARSNRAYMHAFEVVGTLNTVRDIPPTLENPRVRREIIAHQREDHHQHMLGDADAVGVGHFSDRDAVFDGSFQVDVVRTYACSNGKLQLLRLLDALWRQVGRPEWLRDDDIRVGQFALKHRAGAFFIRSDNEGVAEAFEVFA